MTNGLTVAPNERHVLRLFALDVSEDEAVGLRDAPGRDQALGALVGLARIDPAHVEIIDTADLAGVGLAQYLIDGDGAVEAQVAADRARLDALQGWVMIAGSGAFGTAGTALRPGAAARLVGTYRQDVPQVRFEPLPDAGAAGVLTPPAVPPAPRAGDRIGLYIGIAALVVLVLLALGRLIGG